MLQRHRGLRSVAYASTINVTEAIFEFSSYNRDIEERKVILAIFETLEIGQKWPFGALYLRYEEEILKSPR